MSDSSPTLAELARRIVDHEAAGASDPAASAAALEAACGQLKSQLVDFLGSGGVAALLRRALHLAQREQPALAQVGVAGAPDACFTNLEQSLAASTDEDVLAAVAAVLTHVLALLVTLLGEELGLRPVQKLWPDETTAGENDE